MVTSSIKFLPDFCASTAGGGQLLVPSGGPFLGPQLVSLYTGLQKIRLILGTSFGPPKWPLKVTPRPTIWQQCCLRNHPMDTVWACLLQGKGGTVGGRLGRWEIWWFLEGHFRGGLGIAFLGCYMLCFEGAKTDCNLWGS